jgi:hypothetical protein
VRLMILVNMEKETVKCSFSLNSDMREVEGSVHDALSHDMNWCLLFISLSCCLAALISVSFSLYASLFVFVYFV